jgi:osmotically-inducible protein OsmY
MRQRDRGNDDRPSREIDWEWEGATPPGEDERSETDRGYDEAAHRGGRFGVREGQGGVFGTTGGGSYAGGFQVDNRLGSSRGDWSRDELEQLEFAPSTLEWRNGPHSGKGPRGYSRSAERIRDDIQNALEDDGWVDASDISVEVAGGDVTLGGEVESRQMRRRAEELAESVTGVRHVINSVRIRNR